MSLRWPPLLAALLVGASVGAEARAESRALEDAAYCQDEKYPLNGWERDWCPLVGERNRACPSLPKACQGKETRPMTQGRKGRLRCSFGGEGKGKGKGGNGRGGAEGEGEGQAGGRRGGVGEGEGEGSGFPFPRGGGDGSGNGRRGGKGEGEGEGAGQGRGGGRLGEGEGEGQGRGGGRLGEGEGEGEGEGQGRGGGKLGEGEGEGQGPGDGRGNGTGDDGAGVPDDGGANDDSAEATPPPEPPEDEPPPPPPEPLELPESMSTFAKVMFFVLVGAAALWLIWVIWKNRVKGRDEDEDEDAPAATASPAGAEEVPSPQEVETDVDRLLGLARAAADRGAFDEAIEHAYAAALRRLEGDGLIDMHRSRTNGDYVRGLRERPQLAAPLREIVRDVERVQFGTQPPDAGVFQRVFARVVPIVQRAMGVLLVLGCGLFGCNDAIPKKATEASFADTSPSGTGAVLADLRARGFSAGYRVEDLADVDDDTGALLVLPSAEDAFLQTHDKLYDWVQDGGVLVLAGVVPTDPLLDLRHVVTEPTAPQLQVSYPFGNLSGLDLRVPAGPALSRRGGQLHPNVALRRDNGDTYALVAAHGSGRIIVLADDRLVSNISLAIGDNAEALGRMLGGVTGRVELCNDATGAGASSPLESMHNARLTPLVLHLLVLLCLFVLWRGIAFGRRRDPQEHSRRSFADHVRALGTQYARADASAHALGVYARWALERLRERVPRGRHRDLDELAGEVAARSGRPVGYVRVVLGEAQAATEAFGPASVRAESLRGTAFQGLPRADHHVELMQQLTELVAALGGSRAKK